MINKKMFMKLGLLSFVAVSLGFSFTSAINLALKNDLDVDFGNIETVAVSFKDNNNDFGGAMMLFKGGIPVDEEIEINSSKYICERQLKGFYYNAERGDRLWPLDSTIKDKVQAESLSEDLEDFVGGLYTACRKTELLGVTYDDKMAACDDGETYPSEEEKTQCRTDVQEEYSVGNYYYGMIKRKYAGVWFYLVAGVEYRNETPWILIDDGKDFGDTLVSIDTSSPVGFVYDDYGGVGFMHCNPGSTILRGIIDMLNDTSNPKKLGDLFVLTGENNDELLWIGGGGLDVNCEAPGSLAGSMLGLVIEGLVGRTNSRFGVAGAEDPKMQYFSSVSVNNATLLNFTKQKAESLCRGKWGGSDDKIACVLNTDFGTYVDADASAYSGKTLIVKNGDVLVHPSTTSNGKYYDIFVESGNLLIDVDSTAQFVFKKNGFISDKTIPEFNSLIEGNTSGGCRLAIWTGDDVAVASLLRGNFIVDGHVKGKDGLTLNKKYFIHGKFTSRDSYDDLLETFGWRCGDDGRGIPDGNYCPSCGNDMRTACWINDTEYETIEETCPAKNYYTNSPLVVVDQKFDSPLFR